MIEEKIQTNKILFLKNLDIWSINAVLIAALVIAPILSVFIIALTPTENIWPHLLSTTLPRYASNTLFLMFFVGIFSGIIGTSTAWLIARYRFVGSNWLQWALFLPLALPAYVASYALVDLLEYAGPIQSLLRSLFSWQTSQDYWFPEIRSLSSAIFVLSLALYPYVYLMARSAFLEQSDSSEEVAKSLGISALERFFRLGLPLARPAVFAGIALVMMETASDFGAVDFFAVQTLTTGIFSVWLESNNAGGAAQIASTVLILIVILVSLEKFNQRKLRFYNLSYRHKNIEKISLNRINSLIAFSVCFLPIFFGFILPFLVLLNLGYGNLDLWINASLISAIKNTLIVSGLAALITVTLALLMVYGIRLSGKKLPVLILPLTTIGYAAPGAVLGIGILVPLAYFDNWLADRIFDLTRYDPGLIFTGTSIALSGCKGGTPNKPEKSASISKKKVRWKMATAFPKNFPGSDLNAQKVKNNIEIASNGQLTIEHYGAGEIVPAFEISIIYALSIGGLPSVSVKEYAFGTTLSLLSNLYLYVLYQLTNSPSMP